MLPWLRATPISQQREDEAWRKMSCEVVQNTQPWYPADVKLDIPGRGEQKQKPLMNHLLHEGPLAAPTLCKHPEQPGTLLIFLGRAVFGGIGSSKRSDLFLHRGNKSQWEPITCSAVQCSAVIDSTYAVYSKRFGKVWVLHRSAIWKLKVPLFKCPVCLHPVVGTYLWCHKVSHYTLKSDVQFEPLMFHCGRLDFVWGGNWSFF